MNDMDAFKAEIRQMTEIKLMQHLRYCQKRVQEGQERAKALADEMNRRVDLLDAAEGKTMSNG